MTAIALAEFGLGLPADWITPASRCYRPASWPPPRDWVISEDRDGRVVSRWGDPIWDFTPLAGKSHSLNFGDGPVSTAAPLDTANADLLRLAITWAIWGHRPVKAANSLTQVFQLLRPIFALCSQEGILASDLMRFPRVFEKLPTVLAPSSYGAAIHRLHRLLDAQGVLGFVIVDSEGLKRLAAVAPDHERVQTSYIPPRIWSYQVARLKECLDEYWTHRKQVEACFNFCINAYAHNYGSLTTALTTKPVNSRIPFQTPRLPTAGRKSGCVFYGPFYQTAEKFGVHDLLRKWMECADDRADIRQLSSYLTLVQWAGLAYIANFTLQRIEETASLRTDCLQFEQDEKLGRIPIICGDTTKTIQDSDARWPTSPSVQAAVDAMSHIARMRLQCAQANPLVLLTEKDRLNPYLLTRSFEPWAPRPKVESYLVKRKANTYEYVVRMFPKLFDSQQLAITEDDLKLARMLTPNLPEANFSEARVWPLAWHQLRRTGAVNMFASGMLSDASMQFLMKHASRLMPLYYGRGYTKLHLNEEVESLVTATMYEVMAKSMLTAMGDRFVSPRSTEQKQTIVVNLIGDKDARELAKAARRGDVFYRETRLGACTSRTLCSYGGIESVARCAGGDGHKPCADVLYDRGKIPTIETDLVRVNQELERLPLGSPRHNALLMERQGLENFLNVVNG